MPSVILMQSVLTPRDHINVTVSQGIRVTAILVEVGFLH